MLKNALSGRSDASRLSDARFGLILALPAVMVFTVIVLYPFLNSLAMSLFSRSLLRPAQEFIGLRNFERILRDPNFFGVLRSTAIFVAATTGLSFVVGFSWALLLNQGYRGSEVIRGITLFAWIIPGTAIAFLWMWMMHGQYGVFNAVLRSLGITDQNITWLGSPTFAMIAVVLARSWQVTPWYMMLLLGGLQGVSHDQVEAARIDGAGNTRVLFNIVFPGMRKVVALTVLIGVIGSLQHFDIIWVMTQGGPARATATFAVEVYRRAFQDYDLGRAAAVGVIWAMILSVFVVLNLRARAEQE